MRKCNRQTLTGMESAPCSHLWGGARKRERVRCSSLVDWPVYPRLSRDYGVSGTRAQFPKADRAVRSGGGSGRSKRALRTPQSGSLAGFSAPDAPGTPRTSKSGSSAVRERRSVELTNGCAQNAVSAFANCGRAVAHVRGSHVPTTESRAGLNISG